MLVMGIDGGGSNLRVGIYTPGMQPVTVMQQAHSVNPSVVGWAQAAKLLQVAIRAAIQQCEIAPNDIAATGVGIAGADAHHAATWIQQTIAHVLPRAQVVASSDYEIALVGANGERYGVLLLAGTGTVAYGVNREGQSLRIGGWGYQIGDEGSGYWLGLEAIKMLSRVIDGYAEDTTLTQLLRNKLGIDLNRDQLIDWLYRQDSPRTRDIAICATAVLDAAALGDVAALKIVTKGVNHLADMYQHICNKLQLQAPPIAFAGGLLTSETLIAKKLCERLQMQTMPQPQYSPVEGAALLALAHIKENG